MRIKKIISTPKGAELGSQSCLVGISISDTVPRFEEVKLACAWVSARFPSMAILIGDSLYRLTLGITSRRSATEAQSDALSIGDHYLEKLERDIGHLPNVIRTSEVMKTAAFKSAADMTRSAMIENATLRQSVMRDAESYCLRQARQGRLCVRIEEAISVSIQYLIEEIAVYHVLAEQGWLVDAHAGPELPTLAAFINGELPGISTALERRINIELVMGQTGASDDNDNPDRTRTFSSTLPDHRHQGRSNAPEVVRSLAGVE